MEIYLIAALIIFFINALPAFAPPTWSILAFYVLKYELQSIYLIAIGVLASTSGRGFLAWYFRKLRDRLPNGWVTNMENAGAHLRKSTKHSAAIFLLFFISPFSSAQLFEAAGVMKNQPLKPLLMSFGAGRLLTYTTYVAGAQAISSSNLGDLIRENMTSPFAITIQILMVVALVLLGNIKWKAPATN